MNDDEKETVVYEEYESSAAAVKHFETMGDDADAIFKIVDMEGETWGEPSGELRKALAEHGVRILRPLMRLTEWKIRSPCVIVRVVNAVDRA